MNDAYQNNEAYEKALDHLYSLINFEMKRHDRYMESKLDALRPGRLMTVLGSPQQHFPAIHIAGTKGKGSVAAICASVLRAAGLRVGLYTSPHVQEFRERIRILTPEDADGRIPKNDFTQFMQEVGAALESTPDVTWFEVLTAVAFLHFARQQVDVAVVEVGLGGRLDATNVLTPLVSVITSLSYDHTDFLGNTLAEIAGEKGGIIKPGVPLVSADQADEALQRLVEISTDRNAAMTLIGRDWAYGGTPSERTGDGQELILHRVPESALVPPGSSFHLSLSGAHQLENATVALAALNLVKSHFPGLTMEAVTNGLATVSWIGRLQIVHRAPNTPAVLVDCAHNADSAAKLRHALLHDFDYERLWLVLGATQGKDIAGMMEQLLPLSSGTICTVSSHPRASSPNDIASQAASLGYVCTIGSTVAEAMKLAWSHAGPDDLICVTGSIFVVGDLLNEWDSLKSHLLHLAEKV